MVKYIIFLCVLTQVLARKGQFDTNPWLRRTRQDMMKLGPCIFLSALAAMAGAQCHTECKEECDFFSNTCSTSFLAGFIDCTKAKLGCQLACDDIIAGSCQCMVEKANYCRSQHCQTGCQLKYVGCMTSRIFDCNNLDGRLDLGVGLSLNLG